MRARPRPTRTTLIVSTVRDITQRQARVAALERRAASDPLTGVANRTVLIDRLQHALSRLARGDGGLAVLYLDLDRFKVVNDSLGHHVGDGVLLQMAERLTHHLRPSDTLARLGGDEFVIVAEDVADEDKAVEMANRIVNAGHRPFEVGDERFECTVSVGIACTSDPESRSPRSCSTKPTSRSTGPRTAVGTEPRCSTRICGAPRSAGWPPNG